MKIRRRATSFLEKLGHMILSEQKTERNAFYSSSQFLDVIQELPESRLKTELLRDVNGYHEELLGIINCLTPKSDGLIPGNTHENNGLLYNLYQPKNKINKKALCNCEEETSRQIYSVYLSKSMNSIENVGSLSKVLKNCVSNGAFSDVSPVWIQRLRKACALYSGRNEPQTLQVIMQFYLENLSKEDTSASSDSRCEVLADIVTSFITYCRLKTQSAKEFSNPSYWDLIAAVTSIYVDMILATSREKNETERKCIGKRLCSSVLHFVEPNIHLGLDVVIQLENVTETDGYIIGPLYRKLFEKPTNEHNPAIFSKYIIAGRIVMKQLPQLVDDLVLAFAEIRAPKHYLKWIGDRNMEIIEKLPVDRHFKRTKITRYLLYKADDSVVEGLYSILTESLQESCDERSPEFMDLDENIVSSHECKQKQRQDSEVVAVFARGSEEEHCDRLANFGEICRTPCVEVTSIPSPHDSMDVENEDKTAGLNGSNLSCAKWSDKLVDESKPVMKPSFDLFALLQTSVEDCVNPNTGEIPKSCTNLVAETDIDEEQETGSSSTWIDETSNSPRKRKSLDAVVSGSCSPRSIPESPSRAMKKSSSAGKLLAGSEEKEEEKKTCDKSLKQEISHEVSPPVQRRRRSTRSSVNSQTQAQIVPLPLKTIHAPILRSNNIQKEESNCSLSQASAKSPHSLPDGPVYSLRPKNNARNATRESPRSQCRTVNDVDYLEMVVATSIGKLRNDLEAMGRSSSPSSETAIPSSAEMLPNSPEKPDKVMSETTSCVPNLGLFFKNPRELPQSYSTEMLNDVSSCSYTAVVKEEKKDNLVQAVSAQQLEVRTREHNPNMNNVSSSPPTSDAFFNCGGGHSTASNLLTSYTTAPSSMVEDDAKELASSDSLCHTSLPSSPSYLPGIASTEETKKDSTSRAPRSPECNIVKNSSSPLKNRSTPLNGKSQSLPAKFSPLSDGHGLAANQVLFFGESVQQVAPDMEVSVAGKVDEPPCPYESSGSSRRRVPVVSDSPSSDSCVHRRRSARLISKVAIEDTMSSSQNSVTSSQYASSPARKREQSTSNSVSTKHARNNE